MRALKLNKFGSMHCFVDSDKFGNKYFEDTTETYGRHRWVEYAEDFAYDSSKVPPDWHKWLHHNSLAHPKDSPLEEPKYQAEFGRNPTGTDNAYLPDNHRLNKAHLGSAKEKYEVRCSILNYAVLLFGSVRVCNRPISNHTLFHSRGNLMHRQFLRILLRIRKTCSISSNSSSLRSCDCN